MLKKLDYFTNFEKILWLSSVALITTFFFLFSQSGILSLIASLIGTTALIFCAKGNPIGQMLIIIFGLIYAYISYTFSYFGELITYGLMTVPMAVLSLISWLKNPHKGNHSEVEISAVTKREIPLIAVLSIGVTVAMYFALRYLGTANLLLSTFSVFTSFIAVYLTYRRSPYFALAYAVNDVVLVSLWVLASFEDSSYVAVATCFGVFLINDIYGFINWQRIKKRQTDDA